MKKLILIVVSIFILILGIMIMRQPQNFGGATYSPTFTATGTTNSTVAVSASAATLTIPRGWTQFASVSNASTNAVWCSLDNKLTGSSSAVNTGIGIGGGFPSTVTFGPLGQNPYVGAINCYSSSGTVNVGIVYN